MQSNICTFLRLSTFSYSSSSRFSHSLSSLAPNQHIYMTAPSLLVAAGTKRSVAARSLIKDSYRTICMYEQRGSGSPLPSRLTAEPCEVLEVPFAEENRGMTGQWKVQYDSGVKLYQTKKRKTKQKKQVNVSFLNFQKGRQLKKIFKFFFVKS